MLLSKDVPLLKGTLAFAVLAILQYVIAWLAQRVSPIAAAIKAEQRILLRDGTQRHRASAG